MKPFVLPHKRHAAQDSDDDEGGDFRVGYAEEEDPRQQELLDRLNFKTSGPARLVNPWAAPLGGVTGAFGSPQAEGPQGAHSTFVLDVNLEDGDDQAAAGGGPGAAAPGWPGGRPQQRLQPGAWAAGAQQLRLAAAGHGGGFGGGWGSPAGGGGGGAAVALDEAAAQVDQLLQDAQRYHVQAAVATAAADSHGDGGIPDGIDGGVNEGNGGDDADDGGGRFPPGARAPPACPQGQLPQRQPPAPLHEAGEGRPQARPLRTSLQPRPVGGRGSRGGGAAMWGLPAAGAWGTGPRGKAKKARFAIREVPAPSGTPGRVEAEEGEEEGAAAADGGGYEVGGIITVSAPSPLPTSRGGGGGLAALLGRGPPPRSAANRTPRLQFGPAPSSAGRQNPHAAPLVLGPTTTPARPQYSPVVVGEPRRRALAATTPASSTITPFAIKPAPHAPPSAAGSGHRPASAPPVQRQDPHPRGPTSLRDLLRPLPAPPSAGPSGHHTTPPPATPGAGGGAAGHHQQPFYHHHPHQQPAQQPHGSQQQQQQQPPHTHVRPGGGGGGGNTLEVMSEQANRQRQFLQGLGPAVAAPPSTGRRAGGGRGGAAGLQGRLQAVLASLKLAADREADAVATVPTPAPPAGSLLVEVRRKAREAHLTRTECTIRKVYDAPLRRPPAGDGARPPAADAAAAAAGPAAGGPPALVAGQAVHVFLDSKRSDWGLEPGSCLVVLPPYQVLRLAAAEADDGVGAREAAGGAAGGAGGAGGWRLGGDAAAGPPEVMRAGAAGGMSRGTQADAEKAGPGEVTRGAAGAEVAPSEGGVLVLLAHLTRRVNASCRW